MKLSDIPTPSYIIDEDRLESNLECLSRVERDTGCRILLAQKAFSCYEYYPMISGYISGTSASGLYEARLADEYFTGENHVFCPAYTDAEFSEIAKICDHIVFNSVSQLNRFKDAAGDKSLGLRVNPEFSTQGGGKYDPCAPYSRLGVTKANFDESCLTYLDGLHFHTLCEQGAEDLVSTVRAVEKSFGPYLKGMKWLNLGGGHHITAEGYDIPLLESEIKRLQDRYGVEIYLEPGEAVALNAGYARSRVMDIVDNGMRIAILDISAECHMPDVIEMPYRPPVEGGAEAGVKAHTYRLASRTCLAGDVMGDYSFDSPLAPGDTVTFGDMAIYSMVKNNTFNGMPLPAIVGKKGEEYRIIKSFGYGDFRNRL